MRSANFHCIAIDFSQIYFSFCTSTPTSTTTASLPTSSAPPHRLHRLHLRTPLQGTFRRLCSFLPPAPILHALPGRERSEAAAALTVDVCGGAAAVPHIPFTLQHCFVWLRHVPNLFCPTETCVVGCDGCVSHPCVSVLSQLLQHNGSEHQSHVCHIRRHPSRCRG